MKKSQRADHAVVGFRMTRTANEDSPGIYKLGDPSRPRTLLRREKKEEIRP